jgi:PAS domain S-box-containing protein
MPVEQIEGKPAAEIFPQDAAKYYQDDLEVIQTGMPKLGIVEKLHGLENRELWVQTDKVPVCDKDGKVTGIVVMVQDITARKEAEESLALFRALVDQSPDAIEVIDSETGRFLDVNSTGCARLGYSHEEMLSLCVADIDAEKDSGFHWPTIIEEIKKTGFATIISRHRRKDGSTFPVEVNTRYIKLNQGHLVSIVRDITERLQAAKALEELSAKTERRERMLTTALSSMKDFAQIYDKEARFLFANQPLLNLWGLTSQEVVGKSFLELRYPVELAGKLRRQVREVFETRRELIDETHYTSPTGSGAFTNISFRQRSSPMARSISWLEPRAISPSGKGTRRV